MDTAASNWKQRSSLPLAEAIQAVTRTVHAKLNKLIIARLPLALPEATPDSATYLTGLLHISTIYITFEGLWLRLLDHEGTEPTSDLPKRVSELLQQLCLGDLMRSDKLLADLQSLSGWSGGKVKQELQNVSQVGRLGDFNRHIEREVLKKPHILVAYSYILYMALFAGGRFIRTTLKSAGPDFWSPLQIPQCTTSQTRCPDRPSRHDTPPAAEGYGSSARLASGLGFDFTAPFSFFHFSTPSDGEDLKHEFKRRLSQVEVLFTPQEREEIMQEAICIFENMILLVYQLDVACAKPGNAAYNPSDELNHSKGASLVTRLRDSVSLTRERYSRATARQAYRSEDSNGEHSKSRLHQQTSEANASNDRSSTENTLTPHPHIPGIANIELCPAMAKSIRFDRALPMVARPATHSTGDSKMHQVSTASLINKSFYGFHVTNWVIMAAFGVMILGALYGRKKNEIVIVRGVMTH